MTKQDRDLLREQIAEWFSPHGWSEEEIVAELQKIGEEESKPGTLVAIIRDLMMDKPRVVAYVEGGVVQGARASEILEFGVCDHDDEAEDEYRGVPQEEYDALPFGVY